MNMIVVVAVVRQVHQPFNLENMPKSVAEVPEPVEGPKYHER